MSEFIKYLQHPIVSWYAQTTGAYDFIISITPKNLSELTNFYDQLINKFGKHINNKEILITKRYIQTNDVYLYENKKANYIIDEILKEGKKLNEIDSKIINILSKNGTASFVELAKKVNLTPEAVSIRFRKIKNEYITKIKPRIQYKKIGLEYYHLFLSLENMSIQEKIAGYFIEKHNANCIMFHIGNFDMHLEFLTPIDNVENIINDLRKEFENSLKTFELLHIRKEYKLAIT